MKIKFITLFLFLSSFFFFLSHNSVSSACFGPWFARTCTSDVKPSKKEKQGTRYINQVTNKSRKSVSIATAHNKQYVYRRNDEIFIESEIRGWKLISPNSTYVWQSYEESCYVIMDKDYNTQDKIWVHPNYNFRIGIIEDPPHEYRANAFGPNGTFYDGRLNHSGKEIINSELDQRLIREGFIKKRGICGIEIDTVID